MAEGEQHHNVERFSEKQETFDKCGRLGWHGRVSDRDFPILWTFGCLLLVGGMITLAGCTSPASSRVTKAPERGGDPPERAETPASHGDPPLAFELRLDGERLKGWSVTEFAGHGAVSGTSNEVSLLMGEALTGIHWTNQSILPQTDYEISLSAKKNSGSDFFCGLTFPVNDSFCSLIVGGWGGGVVGISSIEGMDASENETTKYLFFEANRWYRIRVAISRDRIQAWIDKDEVLNAEIAGRKIALRPGEIILSKPLGIAAWQTSASIREVEVRRLKR